MSIMLLLSLIACCAMIVSSVTLAVGIRKMGNLGEAGTPPVADSPFVSIVVPACNEEKHIEKSLLSLFAQGYTNMEVIVVNDRSIDNTAAILEKMKKNFPRLIVYEITDLPKGWMGKSHALATGASLAGGDYLLFTDADVVMEKSTVARAVDYMTKSNLDHLTLIFKNISRGWLVNSLILDSGLGLLFFFKPWLVKKSGSRFFMGIGAFNMLKKQVYQDIGGHQGIKMHPIDDMMLGKNIKQHGFLQDCLLAYDYVQLPWYDSVGAMVNGLQKNMFALLHYRILFLPVVLSGIVIVTILPVWGMCFGNGYVQATCLFTFGIRLVMFYKGLRLQGLPGLYVAGCIFTPYISCYIIIKSAFVTIKNGGIIWRGKHYALADLRKSAPFLV